jgi:hypothetical protein
MPLGVPVRITSPGSSVRFVEMKLTSSAGLKMSWLRVRVLPQLAVLEKLDVQFAGSIFVSTSGPSGVKVSNDFARAHWPSAFWIVRSLMSCDAV